MSNSPGRQSRSSKTQYIKRQASKGSAGSYTGYKDARGSRKKAVVLLAVKVLRPAASSFKLHLV